MAGRQPVTSKGGGAEPPSQPRGRTLMHDVPSAGPRCKARRQHASWRLRKASYSYVESGAADAAEHWLERPSSLVSTRPPQRRSTDCFRTAEARSWEREFESVSRYPTGPLETPAKLPFLESGQPSLVTGFSNKRARKLRALPASILRYLQGGEGAARPND